MRLNCLLSPFPLILVHLLFLLLLLHQVHTCTAVKRSYVVYLGGHSHGPESILEADLQRAEESHLDLLESFLGRDAAKEAILYSYTRHINGFSAILEDDHAISLSKHPEVVSVFLNQGRKLHTTRSWGFLGLEEEDATQQHGSGASTSTTLWKKTKLGKNIIIANLDTGVWPESESFNDKGMGPAPKRWKGFCENDTVAHGVRCNRKLIGARYFNKAYLAGFAALNATARATISTIYANTPRDGDGHGTHTLSTAAGSFVPNASVFGYGNGAAKGGSPAAWVATYKVCFDPIEGNECFDSDILAAFDAAISDGVDVISASLGGDPSPHLNDSLSIGSFHATMKGISVVCSAGNSGPKESTVSNVSPWQFTVGASTIDRRFGNWVLMGNHKFVKGQSLAPKSLPPGKFYPIMNAKDAKAAGASSQDALLCKPNSLDPKKAKGRILVCLRGDNARVDKGEQSLLVGAVGMILANDNTTGNEVIADPHVLPASHISYTDGIEVYSYVNSTKSPMVYITRAMTQLGTKPAPFMAAFSSKGPNKITPEILKPDITAPGVSIIAAYTEAQGPTDQKFDTRRVKFNSLSGTSMSCPHVSGVVGLLKTLHPDWSPAAIKSAIMTTASVIDNTGEPIMNSSNIQANPLSYGAGHVQPNKAMDPGLVYDLTMKDYLNFLCSFGYNKTSVTLFSGKPYTCPKKYSISTDFNYPSITVPDLKHKTRIYRTVKNVGSSTATYTADIKKPPGIQVTVKPKALKFKKSGQEKTFRLTLKPKRKSVAAAKGYVFGRLAWSDGIHVVGSPIVVKRM